MTRDKFGDSIWESHRIIGMSVFLLILLVISICVIKNHYSFSLHSRNSPSWLGITPGRTTIEETRRILGMENDIERREIGRIYWIYKYEEVENSDWGYVEIWTEDRKGTRIVIAVLLSYQKAIVITRIGDTPDPNAHLMTLQELAARYGRPELVLWSGFAHTRVPAWPEQGVLANAGIIAKIDIDNRIVINDLLLFEPMNQHQFKDSVLKWPWAGGYRVVSSQNPYPPGRFATEDKFPQDPYDWDEIMNSWVN